MSNLVEHTREELARIGLKADAKDEMDRMMFSSVMEVVDAFSRQGHSGFSAAYATSLIEKALRFEPLSPLTGEDDEWIDVSETIGRKCWQNKRCSKIFKEEDGTAHDVEGKVFVGPDGAGFTNANSWVKITFPYTPKIEYVQVNDNGEPTMNNFHHKVVSKLIDVDETLHEDRAKAEKYADGIEELCKEEFKVTENTSDGYHTFKELYDHRIILFIALMTTHPEMSWRSRKNADGSEWEGWFIAGMHLPTGDISYHLPATDWGKLDNSEKLETLDQAPEFDGHTSQDVVNRIEAWVALV